MTDLERAILNICCVWCQDGYSDRQAMEMIYNLLTEEEEIDE